MNNLNTQVTTGWQRILLAASVSALLASPLVQAETATTGAVSPPPGPFSASASSATPKFRPDPELDGTKAAYPQGMPASFPTDNRRGALTRQQFMNDQEAHRVQQRTDVIAAEAPAVADAQMQAEIDAQQKRWDDLKAEQDKQWELQKAEQAKRWEQQQAERTQRIQQQEAARDQRRQQMQAEQQRRQQAQSQLRSQPEAVAPTATPQARPPQAPAYGYGYPTPPQGYGYGYPPPPYGYGAPGRAYPGYPRR